MAGDRPHDAVNLGLGHDKLLRMMGDRSYAADPLRMTDRSQNVSPKEFMHYRNRSPCSKNRPRVPRLFLLVLSTAGWKCPLLFGRWTAASRHALVSTRCSTHVTHRIAPRRAAPPRPAPHRTAPIGFSTFGALDWVDAVEPAGSHQLVCIRAAFGTEPLMLLRYFQTFIDIYKYL